MGLLQSETETISPDPNIYEVPPGAIFSTSLVSLEEPDTKVKPPEGFQDYENICCDQQTGFEEELFALPVEVIYSTVVKPKRKKCRPPISSMLHVEKNASFNSAEGASIKMTGVTDSDKRSVNGFARTTNTENYPENANCKPFGEHSSDHIHDCNNDASSKSNAIDLKIDGNVVSPTNKTDGNKDNGIAVFCEDSSHSTEICSSLTSCENSSISIKADKYVDHSEDEPIKIMDDNFLTSCGDKVDNNLDTCINNIDNAKFDNCIPSYGDNLLDKEVDEYAASADTEILTEGNSCTNSCENNLIDTRVDIFTSVCEDSLNGITVQDTAASHKNDSVNIFMASCKDNSIDTDIDKILTSPGDSKNHTENNNVTIISGDSSDNSEIPQVRISLLNANLDSLNDELPKSAVRNQENTGNELESKISDISKCDCRNIEDVEGEEASVIEISEDGTWETKVVPPAELGQAKQEDQSRGAEEPEFLCAVDRSAETVRMAYGSQYYVNCPVASVKPMKHEDDEASRNIGAQIMKKYEEERQKLRDNLPDVSLLDVEASLEDIQRERRRIIDNQTVRAKRIDSWIRSGEHPAEIPDDLLELEDVSSVDEKALEMPSSTVTGFMVSVNNPEDNVKKSSVPSEVKDVCTDIANKLPAEGKFRKLV